MRCLPLILRFAIYININLNPYKNMNTFLSDRIQKILFWVLILIALIFLLYPTYLPMVDLPQHAAQVSALDDLLKNKSPWKDIIFIHWDTPYLTMYLVWLGIYQLTDIVMSAKIVVVLEFVFYLYAIRQVRRAFGVDRLFEFVALTCFFGYSFQWGFIGYISGIPVGFLFLVVNKKWTETHQNKYLWQITLLGIWCYGSHVLPYAFFCFLSYAYFLTTFKQHTWKQRGLFTLPYLLFASILLRYLMMPDPAPLEGYFPERLIQDSMVYKMDSIWYAPWDMFNDEWYILAYKTLYFAPFLLGYRLRKEVERYVLFLGTLLIYFVLPRTGFNTFYIYIRFAIFIPIFYYLLWEPKPLNQKWKYNLAQITCVAVGCSMISLMFKLGSNHIYFNQSETMRDSQKMLAYMQPEKRVLGMFNPNDNTENNLTFIFEYHHFLHQWYQAKKHGWADYSFGATHAMPVRSKKSELYPNYGNNRDVLEPNLISMNCLPYDYLLMRIQPNKKITLDNLNQWLAKNPLCQNMQFDKQIGTWWLFRKIK